MAEQDRNAEAKANLTRGHVPGPPLSARGGAPVPGWVFPAIMIATLTIGGWFIIQNLADTSKMEDCQMSGRRNCVPPIDTSKMGR